MFTIASAQISNYPSQMTELVMNGLKTKGSDR